MFFVCEMLNVFTRITEVETIQMTD